MIVRQSHEVKCTVYQLGYGRGAVELKTHAAQLGWNTCNPSFSIVGIYVLLAHMF